MTTAELSETLYRRALDGEQTAYTVQPGDDVPAVRAAIRRRARTDRVKIRTGMWNGTLAVIRADARIWNDTTADMRRKLTPTD